MKRIVHLSFIDYFADMGTQISPGHYNLNITGESKTAGTAGAAGTEGKGLPIDYFILPDGLCINTEGSIEKIASIYYILKKPSPDGILPFIQDIVAFCNDVAIKTVNPRVVASLVPKWKEQLSDKLLEETLKWCERLEDKTVDDIRDLKETCKPSLDFGENPTLYRGMENPISYEGDEGDNLLR